MHFNTFTSLFYKFTILLKWLFKYLKKWCLWIKAGVEKMVSYINYVCQITLYMQESSRNFLRFFDNEIGIMLAVRGIEQSIVIMEFWSVILIFSYLYLYLNEYIYFDFKLIMYDTNKYITCRFVVSKKSKTSSRRFRYDIWVNAITWNTVFDIRTTHTSCARFKYSLPTV